MAGRRLRFTSVYSTDYYHVGVLTPIVGASNGRGSAISG